ncbi:N-acyl homoserine lactonase family protein [Sphingomonas daechungensis]|nr:N-acyl homoserine lactonase family protein [Sphingomonas daechungensis]
MRSLILGLLGSAAIAASACGTSAPSANDETAMANQPAPAQQAAGLSLVRLDCGTPTIKNFDKFFSDKPGLYEPGPRVITDSCYVIRHGDQVLLWDTGFPAAWKGQDKDLGELSVKQDKTIPEQLEQIGLKPSDVDIVGISHMHADHTGQAAEFPNAELLIGTKDFEQTKGKDDPFGPWRKEVAKVHSAEGDVDVFGDGSVMALHLPGHTPDHMALLVKLASGPVLLTGDLYHSREAREKRGVPPFNTSREQTLQSMDAFEKLAKEAGAKVIIQHEPRDIPLLPAFPAAAK